MLSLFGLAVYAAVAMMAPGRKNKMQTEQDDVDMAAASSSTGPVLPASELSHSEVGQPLDPLFLKIYECCRCKKFLKRDQLLILCTLPDGTEDPSYDWEGRLWGECQECSEVGQGMSRQEFKKLCTKYHAWRRDIKSRDVQRVRNSRYEELLAEALQLGSDKTHLLQLFHKVADGTYRFFVCRVLECLFVGRNDQWAHTVPHGWKWACPRCRQVFNPGSGALKATLCYMLPKRKKIVLGNWPATAEESALLGFMEATSELDTTVAANSASTAV